MKKGDDLIREAETIMEAQGIKHALSDLREHLMEEVALTAQSMFDNLLRAGMSEEQAHDITKTYVIDFCRLEWQEGDRGSYGYDDYEDFDDEY